MAAWVAVSAVLGFLVQCVMCQQSRISIHPEDVVQEDDTVHITCFVSADQSALVFRTPILEKNVMGEKHLVLESDVLEAAYAALPRYQAMQLSQSTQDGIQNVTYGLTIEGIQGEDRGTYICSIKNHAELGLKEKEIDVIVNIKKPRWYFTDMNGQEQDATDHMITVEDGVADAVMCRMNHEDDVMRRLSDISMTITLETEAGADDLTQSFTRNEGEETPEEEREGFYNKLYQVQVMDSTFTATKQQNGAILKCTGSFEAQEKQATTRLNVLFAPELTSNCGTEVLSPLEYKQRTIDCIMSMNPAPTTFTWKYQYNNAEISLQGRPGENVQSPDGKIIIKSEEDSLHEYKFSLEISSVDDSALFTEYTLTAENGIGEPASRTIQLTRIILQTTTHGTDDESPSGASACLFSRWMWPTVILSVLFLVTSGIN